MPMDEPSRRFLEAALRRGWLTEEQTAKALRTRKALQDVGEECSLQETLVRMGYLTAEQAMEIQGERVRDRLGYFRLERTIGSGTSGVVYRAIQEPLDRVVAVKVLAPHLARSEERRERFHREAHIAVTLNHKNIVRGLDYGEIEGCTYYAMEYVEGRPLSEILDLEGSLPERRAFDIARQMTRALGHAAEYDLVHRDVKPGNILVTEDGTAKLCDLGLAKPSPMERPEGSRSETLAGTPHYLAPELIRGKGACLWTI